MPKLVKQKNDYQAFFEEKFGCAVEFVDLNYLAHKKVDFQGITSMFSYDTSNIPNYYSSGEVNAQGFLVNDCLYVTLEDPSDGLRSTMEAILKIQGIPEKFKEIAGFHINKFPVGIKSKFFWINSNGYDHPDKEHEPYAYSNWKRKNNMNAPTAMLDLRELESGKQLSLIHFGTSNSDDYYPSYTFTHYPQHIQEAFVLAEIRKIEPENKVEKVKKPKIL